MKITNEGMKMLLEITNKTLKDVNFSFLPSVNAEGYAMLNKCKLLTNFEMESFGMTESATDYLSGITTLITCDLSGCTKITDSDISALLTSNRGLRVLRLSNCTLLTNVVLDYVGESSNQLLLLEINRTPLITDKKIEEIVEKKKPNLRIIRATNMVWSKKNYGLTVPYPSDNYVKPTIKGAKKAAPKKNDDKSPENQLIKLREEMKPKMIYEFYLPDDKKKKGGKKKKK
jgi:hypothetical protein